MDTCQFCLLSSDALCFEAVWGAEPVDERSKKHIWSTFQNIHTFGLVRRATLEVGWGGSLSVANLQGNGQFFGPWIVNFGDTKGASFVKDTSWEIKWTVGFVVAGGRLSQKFPHPSVGVGATRDIHSCFLSSDLSVWGFLFMFFSFHDFLPWEINVQIILFLCLFSGSSGQKQRLNWNHSSVCVFFFFFFLHVFQSEFSGTYSTVTCADWDVCLNHLITCGLHFWCGKENQ